MGGGILLYFVDSEGRKLCEVVEEVRKRQTETVKIEDVPKMGFLRARERSAA